MSTGDSSLQKLIELTCPKWVDHLREEFGKDYFERLEVFIKKQYETKSRDIWPKWENIFKCLRYCSPEDVKVVIVGQDPDPSAGRAHGLAFSVSKSSNFAKEKGSSVDRIFQKLETEYPTEFKRPDHFDLTPWAKQG